jgi:hypothetical protein
VDDNASPLEEIGEYTKASAGTGSSKIRIATCPPSETWMVRTRSVEADRPVVSMSSARKRLRGKKPQAHQRSASGGNPQICPTYRASRPKFLLTTVKTEKFRFQNSVEFSWHMSLLSWVGWVGM